MSKRYKNKARRVANNRTKTTNKLSNKDKKYLDDNFKNGMYVEGYVTMKPTTDNEVALSIFS